MSKNKTDTKVETAAPVMITDDNVAIHRPLSQGSRNALAIIAIQNGTATPAQVAELAERTAVKAQALADHIYGTPGGASAYSLARMTAALALYLERRGK